jgi:hypothetical protein
VSVVVGAAVVVAAGTTVVVSARVSGGNVTGVGAGSGETGMVEAGSAGSFAAAPASPCEHADASHPRVGTRRTVSNRVWRNELCRIGWGFIDFLRRANW